MLENEQILNFVHLAQNGDQKAKAILLDENKPLIKSLIKRFLNKGIEYDDLFQLGCLGFIKAIKNFNTDFNVKFSTYVVPMVIGEIKRFMRDDGAVKVSRAIKSLNLKINKYLQEYFSKNQKYPKIEMIATELKVDEQDVVLAMESSKMPISIYSPIEEGDESLMMIDRITSDDNRDTMLDNIILKDIISKLNTRDKKIIILRYFKDKTQTETAKELNISQVQVSRLENKILSSFKDDLMI